MIVCQDGGQLTPEGQTSHPPVATAAVSPRLHFGPLVLLTCPTPTMSAAAALYTPHLPHLQQQQQRLEHQICIPPQGLSLRS
mmetsp:Transcript_14520/g.39292  ORF Transcript_14520/g.39292 Transcript_14520/m.39292 type:complete len:82 (+) Transcript_14520:59-304(+)